MRVLTNKELAVLEEAHRAERSKRQADRIKTVVLLQRGYSHTEISNILLLDDSTTRDYERQFEEHGLDELLADNFTGGVSKLTTEQEQKLTAHLTETTYTAAKDICHYIQNEFTVSYTPHGIIPLLHRLGFSYKKTKQIPGKADPVKQRLFLKTYRTIRKKVKNGATSVLYFLDGSHPQHNAMPAYGWIKKGEDKELRTNTGRKRVNLNGALNIEDHTVVVREEDTINTDATIALLTELEEKHPKAEKIYCIADNARYYRAQRVREYLKTSKIELIFLPPYAPNLNLIERLWKFFHKKVMYNQYYASYMEFQEAIKTFFTDVNNGQYAAELVSLLAENFQIIGETVPVSES